MLKTISGTFASKFFLALLNFATIILTTRLLDADGRGEISYFVTNMVLVLLFTSLWGGSSLVYLTPRHNFFKFITPTYSWAFLLTAGFCWFLYKEDQLLSRDVYFLFFATLFNSWKATNMMVLLGKEKIKAFNWLSLLHSVLLIFLFLLFYYPIHVLSVESFYWSVAITNALMWLISFWMLFDLGEKFTTAIDRQLMKQLITYGGFAQLANIIQFANYRISYYYIMNGEGQDNAGELGKYSIAVSIAESVWIIGQSLATVQFSRLSNVEDAALRRKITVRLFKFNFLLNLLAVVVLLMIPSWAYVKILRGEQFAMVSTYIACMAVGIFMLGSATSFSAYFGSRGMYRPAIVSSLLAAVVTFIFCQFFLQEWGVLAAAVGSSFSYTVIMLYFLIAFIREEKINTIRLLPGLHEIKLYTRWVKGGLHKWKRL